MKKILKICLMFACFSFVFFSGNMQAANYTDITDDQHHVVYVKPLAKAINTYLDTVGRKAENIDMNTVIRITADTIKASGGWNDSTADEMIARYGSKLAHIEGGKLIVGCGNMDIVSLNLHASPPPCVPTSASYISSWTDIWQNCKATGTAGINNCTKSNTYRPNFSSCLVGCGRTCPASTPMPNPPATVPIGIKISGPYRFEVNLRNTACGNSINIMKTDDFFNKLTITGSNGFNCSKNGGNKVLCSKQVSHNKGRQYGSYNESFKITVKVPRNDVLKAMGITNKITSGDYEQTFDVIATINNSYSISLGGLGNVPIVGNNNFIDYSDPNQCKPPIITQCPTIALPHLTDEQKTRCTIEYDNYQFKTLQCKKPKISCTTTVCGTIIPKVLTLEEKAKNCSIVDSRDEKGCLIQVVNCPPTNKCPVFKIPTLTVDEVAKGCHVKVTTNSEGCAIKSIYCPPTVECPVVTPLILSQDELVRGCTVKKTSTGNKCESEYIDCPVIVPPICTSPKIFPPFTEEEKKRQCQIINYVDVKNCPQNRKKCNTVVVDPPKVCPVYVLPVLTQLQKDRNCKFTFKTDSDNCKILDEIKCDDIVIIDPPIVVPPIVSVPETDPVDLCDLDVIPAGVDCLDPVPRVPVIGMLKIKGCSGNLVNGYTCYANKTLKFDIQLSDVGNKTRGIYKFTFNTGSTDTETTGFPYIYDNLLHKDVIIKHKITSIPGEYNLNISGVSVDGKKTLPKTIKLTIIPNNDLRLSNYVLKPGTAFANNNDIREFSMDVRDSFGNKILKNYGTILSKKSEIYSLLTDIKLDQINNTGNALKLEDIVFENSKLIFKLSSRSPGKKKLTFLVRIPKHIKDKSLNLDNSYTRQFVVSTPTAVEFKKPHTVKFHSMYVPEVNTIKDYELILTSHGLDMTSKITDVNIVEGAFYPVGKYSLFNLDYSKTTGLYHPFNLRIDAVMGSNINILKGMTLKTTSDLWIKYDNGSRYSLSKNNGGIDDTRPEISGADKTTLGLKIVGILQGQGDLSSIESGKLTNFSSMNKGILRSQIHKESEEYNSIQDGKIVKGVCYERTTQEVGELIDRGCKTIIVRNGNLIINRDINSKVKIRVLKSHYSVLSDYKTSGNIYINSNVEYINASIYADGGIISSNDTGVPYVLDSIARTNDLKNQLVIQGTVFTRNTIGGATQVDGSYNLPGGEKTNDYNKAMMFDLNYLRNGGPYPANQKNRYHVDPTVIIYDSQDLK